MAAPGIALASRRRCESGWLGLVAHPVSHVLADHDGGEVDVRARDGGHDRRIDHAQVWMVWTRQCWSTTAIGSPGGPIRAVPQGWNWVETVARTWAASASSELIASSESRATWWVLRAICGWWAICQARRTPSTSRRRSSGSAAKLSWIRGWTRGSVLASSRRPRSRAGPPSTSGETPRQPRHLLS